MKTPKTQALCLQLFTIAAMLLVVPSNAFAGPEPNECAGDSDCMDGMSCIDGWCGFQSECQIDDDCVAIYGAGYECLFMSCGGAVCGEAEVGPEPECEDWSDCPECSYCQGGACEPDSECLAALEKQQACESEGGVWNECAGGSCPMCTDCVAACEFPPATKAVWCEESGGTWNECATSSCPECDDCLAACACPENQLASDKGCVSAPTQPEEPPSAEPSDSKPENEAPIAAASSKAAGCSTAGQPHTPVAPLILGCLLLLLGGRLGRTSVVHPTRG